MCCCSFADLSGRLRNVTFYWRGRQMACNVRLFWGGAGGMCVKRGRTGVSSQVASKV